MTMITENIRRDMLTDIQFLAENIGIRFAGSPEDALSARYIEKRFCDIGLKTHTMGFQFLGWKLQTEALLKITGGHAAAIHCFPYVYSSGTPEGGITGHLQYWGNSIKENLKKYRTFERENYIFNKYAVVDGEQNILAHIVSRDFPYQAKAAPWGTNKLPFTLPSVIVSEQDGKDLERLISEERQVDVYLEYATEFEPYANSSNIIAEIPGKDSRRNHEAIIVGAHYDTQYCSPGAVDNASGVACLLSLAKHFRERHLNRTLLLVAYGAEEIGHLGARYHAETLKAQGRLNNIRMVLNLDMLACTEPNWIHVSNDFIAQESIKRAVKKASIEEKYGFCEIVTPPWPTGDHEPFFDESIPCINFTWRGHKYPYTHLPEDTVEKINEKVLSDSFEMAYAVIENVDKILS